MRPERFHRIEAVLRRRQPDLTVLMERVNKEHNFSAILRNCDAAGVLDAHVVPPAHGLDLHHASSAGTRKWIQVQRHETVADAVGILKKLGFRILAAHPGEASVDYREADFTVPTAIMLGAELHGVSTEGLELADAHVVVPMMGMVHSLNVSVASALLLFEAMRQREAARMYERSRIPEAEFRRTLFRWAYPTLARRFDAEGEPYPLLGSDGEILG
ncbi:MAG: tRNA (guanosine(18)-2'-O)-methyltransferase TrmH [Gemmatimonadota bacterium]|nr:tRNA (guanosine(18)-2'-O)-methyltransferase TrmH [Gemmatimonadota bacterium]MDH5760403.1 tRNA (guanosine(18)-2'-O)-methyltransferase TrmH [Gemmatimonadota bacterium]